MAKSLRNLYSTVRFLTLATWLFLPAWLLLAQEPGPNSGVSIDPDDRANCKRQLNKIYGAIREYRKDHGNKPPDKLSDLNPDYIHDPAVLVCPFVQKRGGLRTWKKQFDEVSRDPYTSYSYEFPPVPADHYRYRWRGLPAKTVQDVRERQVEVFGRFVPIVRCHDHFPWLNLSVGGPIYESESVFWEKNYVEDHNSLLMPTKLFPSPAPRLLGSKDFPPRDPGANPRLLDLTPYYNAALTNSWHGFPGNDLANLPTGILEFDGVQFDVRGVIQLLGTELAASFPRQVTGIQVRQKCSRIHFLHAVSFICERSHQASYCIRYADRPDQDEEFAVIYGKHIADWWWDSRKPTPPSEARVAWAGVNEATKAYGTFLRLYHAVWENPYKEAEIESITFDALPKARLSGPFVIAITLE